MLTVENEAQAWARARVERDEQGRRGGRAALAMIALKRARRRAPMTARAPPERRRSGPANQRGAARLAAVQALYQMELGGVTLDRRARVRDATGLGQNSRRRAVPRTPTPPSSAKWCGRRCATSAQLDPTIDAALVRRLAASRLDATVRAMLRAGAFELSPAATCRRAVVINEYVDVAKAFYEQECRNGERGAGPPGRTLRPRSSRPQDRAAGPTPAGRVSSS